MVKHFSTPFLEMHKEEVRKLVNENPLDSEEYKRGFELCHEFADSERFLLDNGYLRTYRPEYMGWRGRTPVMKHGSVYIGLTEKGWKVANMYIGREVSE